jgi:hypothetical protein
MLVCKKGIRHFFLERFILDHHVPVTVLHVSHSSLTREGGAEVISNNDIIGLPLVYGVRNYQADVDQKLA